MRLRQSLAARHAAAQDDASDREESTHTIHASSAPCEENTRDAIGTGPYRVAEWAPSQRILLGRDEGYWGEPPVFPSGTGSPSPLQAQDVNLLTDLQQEYRLSCLFVAGDVKSCVSGRRG